MDITAERIFEELSAANTAHALPLNFSVVPQVQSAGSAGSEVFKDASQGWYCACSILKYGCLPFLC